MAQLLKLLNGSMAGRWQEVNFKNGLTSGWQKKGIFLQDHSNYVSTETLK